MIEVLSLNTAEAESEAQDLAPVFTVQVANRASLPTGGKYLTVHEKSHLSAFAVGKQTFVSALPGAQASPAAPPHELMLSDSPDESSADSPNVSCIAWGSGTASGATLAVGMGRKISTVVVHCTGGFVVAAGPVVRWEDEEARWQSLSWHSDASGVAGGPPVLAAMAPTKVQVWVCGAERVCVAELAAPSRSAFSAIAWGSERRLVAAVGAEVWVVQWDATWAPVVQKQLFAEGGAFRTLQCAEWAGMAGVVVTIDAPMSLDKSLLEPQTAQDPPLQGPSGESGDSGVLDLRGRLSTASASQPIPSMFLLGGSARPAATAPKARVCVLVGGDALKRNTSEKQRAAGPAAESYWQPLPDLPVPDMLRVNGELVVVGSSLAQGAVLQTFTLAPRAPAGLALVPARRLRLQPPTPAPPPTLRLKGLALLPNNDGWHMYALVGHKMPRSEGGDGFFAGSALTVSSLQVGQYLLASQDSSPLPDASVPAPSATPISPLPAPSSAPQPPAPPAGLTLPDPAPSNSAPLVFDGTFYRVQKATDSIPLGAPLSEDQASDPPSDEPGLEEELHAEDSLKELFFPPRESSSAEPSEHSHDSGSSNCVMLALESLATQMNHRFDLVECMLKAQNERITRVESVCHRVLHNSHLHKGNNRNDGHRKRASFTPGDRQVK
eukprot:CAMPEP_0118920718 /NCGR_PEP_ID=MMETSP1169-20130426/146_1 /TAXON_ID=36882 /ORGANISM="Pyramimonas obovata, Strain CCMP722" /LENGTH=665 /DNA_ID=CAMNT_0006861293 /DNA_START=693 /DNA_END=2690 /DNA_ORIENTATION=-